jgi:hypothetical protein
MSGATIATGGDTAARSRAFPRAMPILLGGTAFGILGQGLFYGAAAGINVPLAVVLILALGWIVRGRPTAPLRWTDAWLPAAAIVLSAFVGLRGDPALVALDLLGTFALTAASAAVLAGRPVLAASAGTVLAAGARLAAAAAGAAAPVISSAHAALPRGVLQRGMGRGGPVLRGALIALPLLALFALLFSAADAVFADLAGDLLDWDLELGSLPGRVAVAALLAWFATGALAFVVQPGGESDAIVMSRAWARRPRLGATEVLTVLVALDLLFAAFVGVQAAYLFGGQDTLTQTGLTYAEYARRGFFELLAVGFGVGGIVLAAEGLIRERTRAYVAAAVGLVLLTLVILASAMLRLRLYQEAYGWTELRFYVLAAIAWLAAGALAAVITLLVNRSDRLLHAVAVLSLVFGLALNVIGPVRFVTEQNVARALDPSLVAPGGRTGLDTGYLGTLGDDAIPIIVDALPRLGGEQRAMLEDSLETRRLELAARDDERTWQAWNLSRERARALLNR